MFTATIWLSFRISSSKSCTLGGFKLFPFMYMPTPSVENHTWYVVFNRFSYELSYKLFPSAAAAGILSLGCRTADVGLLSVIDGVNCSRYIDDYKICYLLESDSEQTTFGTRPCASVSSCASCCCCCRCPVVPSACCSCLFLAAAAASPTCYCCVGWLRLWLALVRW